VTREGVAAGVHRFIIPREIVQLEPVGVTRGDGATAVSTHIDGRIQRHAVHALQPALQGIGIVHALHLLLAQDGARQRPVFIVTVKGFMILQYIGADQGLVDGSVYIGDFSGHSLRRSGCKNCRRPPGIPGLSRR
jgi:hypothetical protein